LYIVDTENTVQVDEKRQRSDKKPERTSLSHGQKFIEEMEKRNSNCLAFRSKILR